MKYESILSIFKTYFDEQKKINKLENIVELAISLGFEKKSKIFAKDIHYLEWKTPDAVCSLKLYENILSYEESNSNNKLSRIYEHY